MWPRDGSPPGSPVPGILQARTLQWVAISFSNAWKWKVKVKTLSHIRLSATPWTAAYQAPPSMRFSRQKYWSGVPLPSPLLLLLNLKHQKQTNQNCHSCFPMKIIQSCPPSLDFPIGPHPQLALSDRLTLADSYLNRNLAIFMLLHAQLAFPCEISTFHSH